VLSRIGEGRDRLSLRVTPKIVHLGEGFGFPGFSVALNPIRGWAAYYRTVVFSSLDNYVWKLTYKWATWRHKNKPGRWIVGR
jgi:RNA-directed DNA polymerase